VPGRSFVAPAEESGALGWVGNADHGKSVLNRNPVSLRNDETVEIHLSDQVKPRLLHDFEVSEPGWDQFLGTLRRHIEGKENQFLSSTKGS
jgi:hypothetical protein